LTVLGVADTEVALPETWPSGWRRRFA